MGEDPTAQKRYKFFGDVLWQPLSFKLSEGFKGPIVGGDGLIKHCFFWPARSVKRCRFRFDWFPHTL